MSRKSTRNGSAIYCCIAMSASMKSHLKMTTATAVSLASVRWFVCLHSIARFRLLIDIIQHLIDGPSRKINQISESIAIFQSAVVVPESKHYSGILSGETLVKYEKLIALTLTGTWILMDHQKFTLRFFAWIQRWSQGPWSLPPLPVELGWTQGISISPHGIYARVV